MDSIKNKVMSGLFWKFSERILAQLVSFAVTVELSRILMPEDYGAVALVQIFITLANIFTVSGFSTALVQKKDADDTDFSTVFYCSLTVSVLMYILLFLAAPYIAEFYLNHKLIWVLRIFSLKLILSSYNSVQHAYVERHMIFKKFFFSTLLGTIVSGFVGIGMALAGYGVWALIAQYLTNSIIDILVLNFTVPWKPQLKFSKRAAKSLMDYGWKVLAADFSGTLFDQLRSLIIGKVYTSADLAYFNKGQQIPSLISSNISQAVMSVLFPAIANASDNMMHVKKMTRRAVQVMAYVIFPLMLGLTAISKPLVMLLFTEKWETCVPYIQILSIASMFSLIGSTSIQGMKAIGRSDVLLKLEFVKKPVYLILLLIGVRISVLATAITMALYSLLASVMNAASLKSLIGYSFKEQLKDLLEPFFLAGIMSVIVYLLSLLSISGILLILIQIGIGGLSYIGMSYLLKNTSFLYLISYVKDKVLNNIHTTF